MRNVLLGIISVLFIQMAGAQSVRAPLVFRQGQEFNVNLQVKTNIAQQAMGQAIDFNVDATGDHRFTVTNSTEENTTLHHDVNRLRFVFDGMGQKRSFDSNEEKDMNGPFGSYAKEILGKKYDMIIGQQGQTLMVVPEKITLEQSDPRIAIINTMLRDVVQMAYPPTKGEPGFFELFPDEPLKPGLTWTRNKEDSSGRLQEVYRISEMKDSTIEIDYNSESVTITKAEMMGNETVTTLNNKSTGKIIVDGYTRLLLEKRITTESNGSSEAPFGTIPVTSKSEAILKVTTKN